MQLAVFLAPRGGLVATAPKNGRLPFLRASFCAIQSEANGVMAPTTNSAEIGLRGAASVLATLDGTLVIVMLAIFPACPLGSSKSSVRGDIG